MCVMSFIWIPRGLEGDGERERERKETRNGPKHLTSQGFSHVT